MNKSIVKTQAVTLPIGTTAALRSVPFDLPSDYKRVSGFYIQRNLPLTAGDYLKVTIKDAKGVNIIDPVNIKFLNGGSEQSNSGSLAIKDKFFRGAPFKAAGTKMIIEVENFATTTAVQDFDFVYECDNEEVL